MTQTTAEAAPEAMGSDMPGSSNISTSEVRKTGDVLTTHKGFRFWAILVSLAFCGLLTSLEATITSTALPSIVGDLGGGHLYIWAVNGYLLTMTSLQPLYGQVANVFGRRWPMIFATATFVLGSGISGGAGSMGMMIGGRVLQGVGASGLTVLTEIIICDLVPLRERGKYLAVLMGMIAVGAALGPFFGGLIVQYSTWRWVFYMGLPIGGIGLVLLLLFLNVRYNKEDRLATRLTRIDWVGDAIFIGACSSVLIALSWAGVLYSWSSYQVLVPLIVGMAGLAGFLVFEGSSRLAPNPTVPLHLFHNRTTVTVFIITLFHAIATMWALYFLPVYFQGVLGASTSRSGLQILPTVLAIVPGAAAAGGVLSKFGRYRPIHFAAWALMIVGFGLFTLLHESSSTGSWVGFQIIEAVGAGLLIPTLLPAVMAPLKESDTALATATWSFMRSFGMTWGTAIPAAIFNTRFDQLAPTIIQDAVVRSQVMGGQAYEHATAAFLETLSTQSRAEFISVLDQSLHRIWLVAVAFAALPFLIVIFEKEIPLRKELDTEYGLKDKVPTSKV